MPTYRVSADIKYLDGILADMVIPDGHTLTMPDISLATRRAAWLNGVHDSDDFIRAAVTGSRYKITSLARVELLID